jgi:Outer membrane protein (OmpH-like)
VADQPPVAKASNTVAADSASAAGGRRRRAVGARACAGAPTARDASSRRRDASMSVTYERHQAEVSRKQAELLGGLQTRMQTLVAAIATTENLSLVLDRSQLHFVKPHLDITNELIRRFDAEKPPAARPGKPPARP